ncbi:MAG: DUF3078 domain-containing protein [Bacteroidales bacterium]|jgi:hypothetical protein|nr:DUF3078 domain-containing protein [Bacteroidales bacterium]
MLTFIRKSPCSIIILVLLFLKPGTALAQEQVKRDSAGFVIDTLMQADEVDSLAYARSSDVHFDVEQALDYLSLWYESDTWNTKDDPLRRSISRLLFEATHDPMYMTKDFIRQYDWSKIKIPASSFFMWDTIRIPIPADRGTGDREDESQDIFDPLMADTGIALSDTMRVYRRADTLLSIRDSLMVINPGDLDNVFVQEDIRKIPQRGSVTHDSIIIVISDTLKQVISSNLDFPFLYYDYPLVGDSIQSAVNTVMDYVERTDSSRIIVTGSDNSIPLWLSNNRTKMTRLWLNNEWDEKVSVWIGSRTADSIDIVVERGVHFRRPGKATNIANAQVQTRRIDNSRLAEARKIELKPYEWKFLSEASFVFNQAMIKNWTQGGESNISTLLDVTGTAQYTNKETKISWNNVGRLKFGLITSAGSGIRKNIDQIELVSKFNTKAFGKFDFSTTMLFNTQLAFGYNYPNDSVVVSKFFNPASLTLGLGLDYKPNDNTSINFAPLSYKGTYVPDTAMIDQTKHGLMADQRFRHEPGMSAQLSHKTTLFDQVTMVNKVRLFTNYIHNPLNIDVDWEMIATTKLNWFTDIRLNTHLIYDDDTLIPVLDEDGEQVMNEDGSPRKVPKIQFKELIGISLIFRF